MQAIRYVLEAPIQAINVGCPPNKINELIFSNFDPMDLLLFQQHLIKKVVGASQNGSINFAESVHVPDRVAANDPSKTHHEEFVVA
jgi:hypothetical protein